MEISDASGVRLSGIADFTDTENLPSGAGPAGPTGVTGATGATGASGADVRMGTDLSWDTGSFDVVTAAGGVYQAQFDVQGLWD